MQDSVRDAFMVAQKSLGYSLNSTDPGELSEAKDFFSSQKPLVQAYVVDQVRDKMLSGEAAVGVIYSGELLYLQEEDRELESGLYAPIRPSRGGHQSLDRLLGDPLERQE